MKRTAWAYKAGNGIIYKFPALLKLIFLALFTAAVLFAASHFSFAVGFISIGGAAAVIIFLALASKIMPWELLAGIRPLFIMLLFVIIFRSINFSSFTVNSLKKICGNLRNLRTLFDGGAFIDALRFSAGIVLAFAASSLFFSSTSMASLRKALPGKRFALALSLMLGFIPAFFEIWENSSTACEARGCRGVKKLFVVIPLTCERMMERAAETAVALEARGLQL